MYRLLLLDDEEFVLKGIQRVYDLPSYGFEVVGAFSNPLKAVEQLEDLKPDLVITDVKMPAMDGLEFADEVKKRNPDAEVVILSGYDDFSYAQAAVKLGVSDYLLKPIKKDDFISMLRHMYRKIEEKQSREKSWQILNKLLENNWIELKNRYYLALTELDNCDEELYEVLLEQGQIDFQEDVFLLIKMDTDQLSLTGDFVSEIAHLSQEVEMLLADYGDILEFYSDESLYFVLYRLDENKYDEVCDTISSLAETRRAEGIDFPVGFSYIHHGQGELFQARNDCTRRIFMMEANIDESSEANPVKRQELNLTIPYVEIENLFQAISMDDPEGVDTAVNQIYTLPRQNLPVLLRDYVSSITFLILLRIFQMQNKYDAQGEIVSPQLLDLKYLHREYPSLEEQKTLVKHLSLELKQLTAGQNEAAPSRMIQAALEYINQHFSENISLQEVADNINISKNYLCDIFKKEIGVTFINYVTGLRIEKAKDYLRNSDMKMYEVSAAVGYNDYAYFSQIFKKNTGVTLSAYRKKL
ncbi:MAG: response regulator [Clostridiales bacterium]|nr:response regulator [Clostridiales bacterium]